MKKETKQPYYIFLDIDGTLYDATYVQHIYGPFTSHVEYPVLKPESINAVNLLLRSLESKFNT